MAKPKTKKVKLGKRGSFTSHPGRLHREMGIPEGEKIGVARERKALKSKNPQERRDARSALGYAAMNKGKRRGGKKDADRGSYSAHTKAIGSY